MNEQETIFLRTIEEHKQLIYKVCFVYATQQNTIDDLYQEVVLNLWKALPRFRNDSKLSTWVYRIALNTCVSCLRSAKRQPQTVPFTLSMANLFSDVQEKANLGELYRLIGKLGEMDRAVILLWLDENSYKEIAEILGISPSVVGVRINRIKAKLREMSN